MRLELDLCTAGRNLRRDRLGLDKELRHASGPLADKPSAKVVRALLTGRGGELKTCLLYTSPSPRDGLLSRMPSSA